MLRIVITIMLTIFIGIACQTKSNTIHKKVKVQYVYDGDTFKGANGKRYRLIGIDAPETAKGDSILSEPYADYSKQFLKSKIDGKYVGVEYDVETYDKYGRELVYVWLNDSTMINELMLKQGHANLLTIPPNVKYSFRLVKAKAN